MTALKPVRLTVDAEAVRRAAASRHGLTYKGFGVLSGNATSSLLLDYKAEHPREYWRLIETLFGTDRPIMNLVKMEMGNDRNNSTGPNTATMREPDEYPAVTREPGFQLAADVRRYQPDLHVSMLRWHAPTWVRSNDDVYRWYKNTILAVWREYGYMVDTVNPDVNERTADLAWVAEFKRRVAADETGFIGSGPNDPNAGFHSDEERELFHRIRVITSDEEVTGTFGPDLIADADLREAIDIAAYHYSVVDDDDHSFTRLADDYDKEIWNSEAQATFSNSADRPNNTMSRTRPDGRLVGDEFADEVTVTATADDATGTGIGGIGSPLEMANTLIKGFVRSRRTNAIYQPAIGAFYEGLEYSYKELISARDPWSGWMHYDAGLVALQHFCRFARFGYGDDAWRALPSASICEVGGNNPVCGGREGEPSAMTLVEPDGEQVSTVIVNDSGLPREYRIGIGGIAAAGRTMRLWRTRAAGAGLPYDAEYLQYVGDVEPNRSPVGFDGSDDASMDECDADSARFAEYAVTVEPWSMVTLTSLDVDDIPRPGIPHTDERARTVLDVDPEGRTLYEDDFEYADERPVSVWKHGRPVEEEYLDSRGGAAGAIPRYTTDTNGAFEVVPYDDADWGAVPDGAVGLDGADVSSGAAEDAGAHGTHVLRQQVDWRHAGNAWIEGDPRTSIGDMRWMNYRAGVDVLFEPYEGRAPYVLLGVREMGGSKFSTDLAAYDFKLRADGVWLLRRYGDEVRRGHGVDLANAGTGFRSGTGVWNRVELQATDGEITVFVNGVQLTQWTDPHPQNAGRVQLGTSFDHVLFDRLSVERVAERASGSAAGYRSPAYCRELIDDMHMRSWDDGTPVIRYAGPWTHENGKGMFDYQRTTSTALRAGASLTLETDAEGVDLFARNTAMRRADGTGETARFDVFVDGEPWRRGIPTMETDSALRTALIVRGLPAGRHRVAFALANDIPFALDAVGLC